MALVDSSELISISDASKLGVSGLVRQAEAGHEQVLLRNNKPVAAVLSMKRLEQFQRLQEDMLDLSLAISRMLLAGERRHRLDEVLEQFGYSREQLRDLPE